MKLLSTHFITISIALAVDSGCNFARASEEMDNSLPNNNHAQNSLMPPDTIQNEIDGTYYNNNNINRSYLRKTVRRKVRSTNRHPRNN